MVKRIRTFQKMRRISKIGHTFTLLPKFQVSSGICLAGGTKGCNWDKDEYVHQSIVLSPSPDGRNGLAMWAKEHMHTSGST